MSLGLLLGHMALVLESWGCRARRWAVWLADIWQISAAAQYSRTYAPVLQEAVAIIEVTRAMQVKFIPQVDCQAPGEARREC